MQNLGWLYSLWPALKRLYPEPEERSRRALEHVEYFSTHPYTAPIILGVVAGLEEKRAAGGEVQGDQILAAKKFMAGPMAALGEAFFWGTARPLLVVFSLSLAWYFWPGSWRAAPLLFLALYNSVHLAVRAAGLAMGYKWKTDVIMFLLRLNLQKAIQGAALVGTGISMGGLAALLVRFGPGRAAAALFAALTLAGLWFGLSPAGVLALLIGGSLGWGILKGL
jgi:mannose/fructose/N-acetylgalactosamine-specific phosphotransferase system component IID